MEQQRQTSAAVKGRELPPPPTALDEQMMSALPVDDRARYLLAALNARTGPMPPSKRRAGKLNRNPAGSFRPMTTKEAMITVVAQTSATVALAGIKPVVMTGTDVATVWSSGFAAGITFPRGKL